MTDTLSRPFRFGFARLKFGYSTPELVPPQRVDFYSGVVTAVTLRESKSVGRENDLTVPISSEELMANPRSALLRKLLGRAGAWPTYPDVLLIDAVFGDEIAVPGRLSLQIAEALVLLVKRWKLAAAILLVDDLPPQGEASRRVYQGLIDDGKLFVIDSRSQNLGDASDPARLIEQYDAAKRQETETILRRLRRKMVRRLGHFRRSLGPGGANECMRYFYDGRNCIREVTDLIVDYARVSQARTPVILFDRDVSVWMDDAVRAAATELGAVPLDVRSVLDGQVDVAQVMDGSLLVLPLVDTGRTVSQLLTEWKDLPGSPPIPSVVAVLSTSAEGEDNGKRLIGIGAGTVEITHFLKVDRGLQRFESCPMCSLGVPATPFGREPAEQLSAYDFWELVDEAGWISEENVPPTRVGRGLVPHFARMFHENGAWLATKSLHRIERALGIGYPVEPIVVVTPDEDGARALAENIVLLHRNAVLIPIPSDAISVFRNGQSAIDLAIAQWRSDPPRWFHQLALSDRTARLVFVEEFTQTGGTCRAVTKLVRALRLNIQAHALVCDFRPSRPHIGDEAPRVPLYEFDMELESA